MRKQEDTEKQMKLDTEEVPKLVCECPECGNKEDYNFKICPACSYNLETHQTEVDDEYIRADDEDDARDSYDENSEQVEEVGEYVGTNNMQ